MFVGSVRKALTANVCSEKRTYKTKHGTIATMNTANIGGKPKAEPDSDADDDGLDIGSFDEVFEDDQPQPGRRPDGRDHPDMDRYQRDREFPEGKRPAAEAEPVESEMNKALAYCQKQIQALRDMLEKLSEGNPFLSRQQVVIDLTNVWTALKFARPHAICPDCNGDGCNACKGAGWMPKTHYDRAVAAAKEG